MLERLVGSVTAGAWCHAALALAWACGASAGDGAGPTFADVAVELGLTRVHTGGDPEKEYIVEAKGGGAAWLDFDGDGDLDIYWVDGAVLDGPRPDSAGSALYRNDGAAGFCDVAEPLGVRGRGWGMGAVSADYDNDADPDLYITCLAEDLLYRNDGGAGFGEVAAASGLERSAWTTGAAFGDCDLDGDLDLYVAGYARLDTASVPPLGGHWRGVSVFVGPKGLTPETDALYRNDGRPSAAAPASASGGARVFFADVSVATGVARPEAAYGFAVLFVDYDEDGDPDLFVANDSTPFDAQLPVPKRRPACCAASIRCPPPLRRGRPPGRRGLRRDGLHPGRHGRGLGGCRRRRPR